LLKDWNNYAALKNIAGNIILHLNTSTILLKRKWGASMMLVKKMLNGIMMKEITIKELADQYDVSTRTI